WVGDIFYFGTFSNQGLDDWMARADKSDVTGVHNGLIALWGALRQRAIDGWPEFQAVLTSTATGSWGFPGLPHKGAQITGDPTLGACYPYTNTLGVRLYVHTQADTPVPTGVSELPIALNLRVSTSDASIYSGRIDSTTALHYAATPSTLLQFVSDP